MSLARYFPLPFTCQHAVYRPGVEDTRGNDIPDWMPPVSRACAWWAPSSTERDQSPTGSDRVIAGVVLVLDSAVTVDHRDHFTIAGLMTPVDRDGQIVLEPKEFTVVGLPKDYNHGPFGFSPDRLVVELKAVTG
ncbi:MULTISPECIES: hypothetical protein [unclassified Mycolicibacterium]|uniref:hypothetical protein n=1 Tax=unclassified Mycolicibacterium TaxID=2636767 RepID=UPI001EE3BE72|nr:MULTISPECIES: hypothetical protein [unclassified Mycolicibacterium]